MNVGPKLRFWRKRLFGLFLVFHFEWIYWWKLPEEIHSQSRSKIPPRLLSCICFQYKFVTENFLFLKLCFSFILENRPQDRVAEKKSNLVQFPTTTLFPNDIRDFWYSISFPFFYAKNTRFCENELLRAIIWKQTKTQISFASFCRPRLHLHVSKIIIRLWCSQIEISCRRTPYFEHNFGRYLLFLTSFNLHFKELSNKINRIKIRPQTAKIAP